MYWWEEIKFWYVSAWDRMKWVNNCFNFLILFHSRFVSGWVCSNGLVMSIYNEIGFWLDKDNIFVVANFFRRIALNIVSSEIVLFSINYYIIYGRWQNNSMASINLHFNSLNQRRKNSAIVRQSTIHTRHSNFNNWFHQQECMVQVLCCTSCMNSWTGGDSKVYT